MINPEDNILHFRNSLFGITTRLKTNLMRDFTQTMFSDIDKHFVLIIIFGKKYRHQN